MSMKFVKRILFLIILAAGFAYFELYSPASNDKQPVFFEINASEHLADILPRLQEKHLIRNQIILKLYARATDLDTKIKAGRFRIDAELSPAKVLAFLANPEHGEISVTIPEGFSVFDIDKKLAGLEIMQKGDFIKWAKNFDTAKFPFIKSVSRGFSVEGYLFPDTYLVFAKNFTPQDLGRAMLQNFEKKILSQNSGLTDDLKKNKHSLAEIITMASILEKEVRTKEDYALISGILWKRLESGWPLQADATLLYGKADRALNASDIHDDSDYNTYTRQGLPITPIGNPGLAMIRAALNPADSPYWFYLTTKEGKVMYAKTNEEHNRNKRKSL